MAQIQWFPGHMTKAKREIEEKIKMVDMVIELRDARIPASSANPLLHQITNNKPRLIILTKEDKADAKMTSKWISELSSDNTLVISADLTKGAPMQQILAKSKELLKAKFEREARKGIRPRAIRAMIIGIPNVGKSTLINRMAKRKATITGDRPGVTKATQWIKVNNDFELLDTPGVLWPKFEDEQIALRLAVTGAIRDQILPIEEVVHYALSYIHEFYPELIMSRYGVESIENTEDMLLAIGDKRKMLKSGGEVDIVRVREMLLREVRDNDLGPMTWERL
ncbi:MAG: ribosome biogenesis GTPase YlqF [Erysipelotrichales bacterium]|nr:ribosome biogenesis GTPase YlqF [Erysipelotrichales bacterium]